MLHPHNGRSNAQAFPPPPPLATPEERAQAMLGMARTLSALAFHLDLFNEATPDDDTDGTIEPRLFDGLREAIDAAWEMVRHTFNVAIPDGESPVTPDTAKVAGTDAGPDADSDDDDELNALWMRTELLWRLMESAYPAEHELLRRFRYVHDRDGKPALGELRELHRIFFALPDAEQRRVLNGWMPDAKIVTRGEIEPTPGAPMRVLDMSPNNGRVLTTFEWIISENLDPFYCYAREGATKAEVLDGLQTVTNWVREHWEKDIAEEVDYPRTTPAPVAATPSDDAGEFPLEHFKDLIRWYLRENLDREKLNQFMRSTGHQYIGITIMDRQDGGEDLPVIEWTLADEIGINDDDGDDDDEPSDSPAPEPAESAV
jgi:hypothetical protein